MSGELKILGASVSPATSVSDEEAARRIHPRLPVRVDVENTGSARLYVFSSRLGLAFDAATGVLTLELAALDHKPPPGIKKISHHVPTPKQVVIEPGGKETLDVPVPTMIPRVTRGEGIGRVVRDEPIDDIRKIQLRLQYSDTPFHRIRGAESSDELKRLREHGHVVRKTVSPTKGRSR